MGKLSAIRTGKENSRTITIPGTEIKTSLVLLTSSEIIEAKSNALKSIKAKEEAKEILTGDSAELIFGAYILAKAMRDPDDPTLQRRLADDVKEVLETFTDKQIIDIMQEYNDFRDGIEYSLDEISNEELEDVKKNLEKIEPKDLDGMSCVFLRNFLLVQKRKA